MIGYWEKHRDWQQNFFYWWRQQQIECIDRNVQKAFQDGFIT